MGDGIYIDLEQNNSELADVAEKRGKARRNKRMFLVGIALIFCLLVLGIVLDSTIPKDSSLPDMSTSDGNDTITAPPASTSIPTIEPTQTTTVPSTLPSAPTVNATTLVPGSGPYVCTGDDRLNHEEPLYSGQVLCSSNDKYVFGMHADGRFIKWDVVDDHGKFDVFYQGNPGDWLLLRVNGDLEIYNLENQMRWKRQAKFEMTNASCLAEYDCPYMHLHNDGVLVLNWRDSNGAWQMERIKKAYDL